MVKENGVVADEKDATLYDVAQGFLRFPAHSQRFYSPFWDRIHQHCTHLVASAVCEKIPGETSL